MYVKRELPDVQAGFRKGRGTRDQIANIRWITEKAREYQKSICFYFIDYAKPLTVWITTNSGKLFKRWESQITLPASWERFIQVKKQHIDLDIQQTGSKLGKKYTKAVYCHLTYLTYIQNTSWEMLDWMKHKMESRLPGEISITQICKCHPRYGRKWRRTKEPLDESERGIDKSCLKLNIQKT